MAKRLEWFFDDWTNPTAGEFFFTSSGEYSDYGVGSFYRVLRDIDITAAIRNYRTTTGRKNGIEGFLKFLSNRGDIDSVPTRELHSSYYD